MTRPEPSTSTGDVSVRAAPQLLSATVGPSLLLLDRWTGATATLDPGTALVWTSTVDGPSTATEIAEAIASDLGGTVEDHLPHVRQAIARLLREDLLLDAADPTETHPNAGTVSETAASGSSLARRSRVAAHLRQRPDTRTDVLAIGTSAVALVTFDDDVRGFSRSGLGRLVVETPTAEPEHHLTVVGSRRSDLPFRLLVDGVLKHRAASPEELLRQVTFELNVLARTPAVSNTIALHSGAVERDGRVLLLAGVKGAGKSTLTAALVQRGARYVTDEVAVVKLPGGRLCPYPKPLDLSLDSERLLGLCASGDWSVDPQADPKTSMPVDSLGAISRGGTATGLLMLDPLPGPTAHVDAAADKVAVLLANSFAEPFDRWGHTALLQEAVDWIDSVTVVRAGRGDLATTVELAESLLEHG
jgi:hypothetical protein